jgi:hypothetical protein
VMEQVLMKERGKLNKIMNIINYKNTSSSKKYRDLCLG